MATWRTIIVRHPKLISLNNLSLEHLHPHLIPHVRQRRSRLVLSEDRAPRSPPGADREEVAYEKRAWDRGPTTLISLRNFFWSAEKCWRSLRRSSRRGCRTGVRWRRRRLISRRQERAGRWARCG